MKESSRAELQAENELLRRELKVVCEAAALTADLVVKQFELTEAEGEEAESIPSLAGIDRQAALKGLKNKTTLFAKLLRDFHRHFASLPATLRELAAAKDWAQIGRHAHTVKGVARYVGAVAVAHAAADLEAAVKMGCPDDAADLLSPLVAALDEVLDSLAVLADADRKAERAPAVAPGCPLDPAVVAATLQTLVGQLRQGEMVAVETLAELDGLLAGHGYDRALARMRELLDDIEYEAAAAVAGEIAVDLEEVSVRIANGRADRG